MLRPLDALDIRLAIASDDASKDEVPDRAYAVDIDAIVAKAKTSEP